MKTIYKYEIQPEIALPAASKIVYAAIDNKNMRPTIWVELNPNEPSTERRKFEIFGTGHEIPLMAEHIMSYQEGPFVWHIYEVFL